jgi:hypothetical protein
MGWLFQVFVLHAIKHFISYFETFRCFINQDFNLWYNILREESMCDTWTNYIDLHVMNVMTLEKMYSMNFISKFTFKLVYKYSVYCWRTVIWHGLLSLIWIIIDWPNSFLLFWNVLNSISMLTNTVQYDLGHLLCS